MQTLDTKQMHWANKLDDVRVWGCIESVNEKVIMIEEFFPWRKKLFAP